MLVAMPRFNSQRKRDASGAFHPEALAFCSLHGCGKPAVFNNREPMGARFDELLQWLRRAEDASVSTLAVFCHGFKSGLQCGATTMNATKFATELARVFVPGPRIALYACDTGRDSDHLKADDREPGPGGEGGYADRLRGELEKQGVYATIFAHATAGHTTFNPYVRAFSPRETGGGRWIVTPHSRLWVPWRRALRRGTLRFRFPFMSTADVHEELAPSVA